MHHHHHYQEHAPSWSVAVSTVRMRSENMSISLLTAYHITKSLFPRPLNTMVTADFGRKQY